MTNEYLPIDCDQHSVLELLAMRRIRVVAQARQQNGEGQISAEGEVHDVLTRDGAEYLLLLEPGGNTLSIRLDRLLGLKATDGGSLWRQKSATGQ